jgi:hypothetical protein
MDLPTIVIPSPDRHPGQIVIAGQSVIPAKAGIYRDAR